MWIEKVEKLVWLMLAVSLLALVGMNVSKQRPKDVHVAKPQEEEIIRVSVTGEVNKPGEYAVKKGTRICDLIYSAGGITHNADIDIVDLDALVIAGTEINIPKLDEDAPADVIPVIDINTATKEELMLIPGVGELLAERIEDYRKNVSPFKDVSEIKNVRGIGEKTFEQMKDYIKAEQIQ